MRQRFPIQCERELLSIPIGWDRLNKRSPMILALVILIGPRELDRVRMAAFFPLLRFVKTLDPTALPEIKERDGMLDDWGLSQNPVAGAVLHPRTRRGAQGCFRRPQRAI